MSYREIDAINQSSLKEILKSPRAYQKAVEKTEDSEEKHFVLGSLLDEMILEDSDYIDNHYYRMGEVNVSDSIKDIIKYVYEMASETDSLYLSIEKGELDDFIVKGCRIYGWNPKWGAEALAKNVKAGGGIDYYKALLNSKGKTIISELDYSKAITAKMTLISDRFASKFLVAREGVELIKKKRLLFNYKNFSCKGEVDLICINHNTKTIYPIDLKSIGMPTEYFPNNFWKFRYDFQAVFYEIGLEQDADIIELMREGYSLADFIFIAADIENTSVPLVYQIDKNIRTIALTGGNLSNGRYLEGINQAFERLEFHIDKGEFTYPKEMYQGPLKIMI